MIPGEHEYWTVYYRSMMTESPARPSRNAEGSEAGPKAFCAAVASALFAWTRSFRGLLKVRSR